MNKCKHEKTRKLFFVNKKRNWHKTNYAICDQCKKVIKVKKEELEE